MERSINFRGIAINPFDGWVYGNLLKLTDSVTEITTWYIAYETGEKIAVRPETVGQHTGLRDSRGIDIYEGGIVQWADEGNIYTGTVFWSDDSYGWRIQMPKGYMPSFKLLAKHTELIGNIYENHNLLTT